jgi:hypothetical protein
VGEPVSAHAERPIATLARAAPHSANRFSPTEAPRLEFGLTSGR